MAVKDTIELNDLFSPVLNSVVNSAYSAVSAMEALQHSLNTPFDTASFNGLSQLKDNLSQNFSDVRSLFSLELEQVRLISESNADSIAQALDNSHGVRLSAFNMMDSYTKQITASGAAAVAEAQKIAGRIKSALASASTSVNINLNPTASAAPLKAAEMNASGTTNSADVFIAGENGPELVVGKPGSTVFPSSETNRIISALKGVNYLNGNSYYNALNNSAYSNYNENVVNNYNTIQSIYDNSQIIPILETMQNTLFSLKEHTLYKNENIQPVYNLELSLPEKFLSEFDNTGEISNYSQNVLYGDTYANSHNNNSRIYNTKYGGNLNAYNDFIRNYGDSFKSFSSINNDENISSYTTQYGNSSNTTNDFIRNYGDSFKSFSSINNDESIRSYTTQYGNNSNTANDLIKNYGDSFKSFSSINNAENIRSYTTQYGNTSNTANDFIRNYGDSLKNISNINTAENIRSYTTQYGNSSNTANDFIRNYGDSFKSFSSINNDESIRSYTTQYGNSSNTANDFIRNYGDSLKNISNINTAENIRSYTTQYGNSSNTAYDLIRNYGDTFNNFSNMRNAESSYSNLSNYNEFITDYGGVFDHRISNTNNYSESLSYHGGSPVEYSAVDNALAEKNNALSEFFSSRRIDLNINGSGSLSIHSNMDKNEIISVLLDNIKPVLMNVVEQELFEEGVSSYEY